MRSSTDRPLTELQRFAALLGWSPLRIYQQRPSPCSSDAKSPVATWYESRMHGSPSTDCFLQFNESPNGQRKVYEGSVYAIRYRIWTGWHGFELPDRSGNMKEEVSRVSAWLHAEWFGTIAKRREFRRLHAECVGYTWHRVREWGPPHRSW